jgi:hypothetical protein
METSQLLPHYKRCLYPSKVCHERRVMKVDGGLHRLCDFHRSLAIRNQKRWQQRRRTRKQLATCAHGRRATTLQCETHFTEDAHVVQPSVGPVDPVDALDELWCDDLASLFPSLDSEYDLEILLDVLESSEYQV